MFVFFFTHISCQRHYQLPCYCCLAFRLWTPSDQHAPDPCLRLFRSHRHQVDSAAALTLPPEVQQSRYHETNQPASVWWRSSCNGHLVLIKVIKLILWVADSWPIQSFSWGSVHCILKADEDNNHEASIKVSLIFLLSLLFVSLTSVLWNSKQHFFNLKSRWWFIYYIHF